MEAGLKPIVCCGLDLSMWDYVKTGLQEAFLLDVGRMSMDDVKDALENKEMQLWGIHNGKLLAVMVTQIVNYPQLRALKVVAVYGTDMDEWLDVLIKTIEEYGGENGCHLLEFTGRKGWEKTLSKLGWGNTQIMMSRSI